MSPATIKEAGDSWTVENARPRAMRVAIGLFAPIAIAFVGLAMVDDVRGHKLGMLAVRGLFALFVAMAAVFSLFGSESLSVESGELVWRRGSSQERRCAVADVEKLEREGNHLRVHVRGEPHPIVVGAGLRQPPAAMAWLTERVHQALLAAQAAASK